MIGMESLGIASSSLKGRYLEERLAGLASPDGLLISLIGTCVIAMFKSPPVDMG